MIPHRSASVSVLPNKHVTATHRSSPILRALSRACRESVRRYPQTGHMINMEAPDQFNEEVLRFLASKCPPKIVCN